MNSISGYVLAVPLQSSHATVVNVPPGVTSMRFACTENAWMLLGSELAEVPSSPLNDGTASALLQTGLDHTRQVVGGQRLSFIIESDPAYATVEFF